MCRRRRAQKLCTLRAPWEETVLDLRAEELVPEIETALENGRRFQDLISAAGVRYTNALKNHRKPRSRISARRETAMLSDSELLAWHARRGTPERTRSVISHIRSTDPARRVGGGRCNVGGRYPSRKMGVIIHFESHRVELAAIYELEHDPEVLEYYDQPPAFKLDYQSASGRHLGILHTADYFVIRGGSAGWEECKTQEELVQYSERNAKRYRTECDGAWHCPPGEAHAAALGLYYRVRSSCEINWSVQRNPVSGRLTARPGDGCLHCARDSAGECKRLSGNQSGATVSRGYPAGFP